MTVYQQNNSFRVKGVTFSKGDPVVVKSRVTGEEFHGEITVVKPKAVSVCLLLIASTHTHQRLIVV